MSDKKGLHFDPQTNQAQAGGNGSEGRKTIVADQTLVAEQICVMAANVRNSMELMKNLRDQQTEVMPIQIELRDRTIDLLSESKTLNKSVVKTIKTGEETLKVLETMVKLTEQLLEQTIQMTASTKLMQVQAEENMKQLNRNTAALFTSYVTKIGTVTETKIEKDANGNDIEVTTTRSETDFEWFVRILDNSDKLFEMYEAKRKAEMAAAMEKLT